MAVTDPQKQMVRQVSRTFALSIEPVSYTHLTLPTTILV